MQHPCTADSKCGVNIEALNRKGWKVWGVLSLLHSWGKTSRVWELSPNTSPQSQCPRQRHHNPDCPAPHMERALPPSAQLHLLGNVIKDSSSAGEGNGIEPFTSRSLAQGQPSPLMTQSFVPVRFGGWGAPSGGVSLNVDEVCSGEKGFVAPKAEHRSLAERQIVRALLSLPLELFLTAISPDKRPWISGRADLMA